MSPEFVLPVTEEEYQSAGSKFVVFPPGSKVGDNQYRDVEMGMPDWDTPGQSIKFPVSITEEGPDKGKEDKISTGVGKSGVWKLKEVYRSVTGEDLPMKKQKDGSNHPVLDPTKVAGKTAVAQYQMQKGKKGGDPNAEDVTYPKLIAILPAGTKPEVESLM